VSDLRPIAGYPNYRVSRGGVVYSRARTGRWHRLVPFLDTSGYPTVILYRRGEGGVSVGRNRSVHRIVLEAFVGPRPTGMQCRHLDGNPRNNWLDNLRWGTPCENAADAARHGRTPRGERNGNAVLTDAQAREVFELYRTDVPCRATLARMFGVSWGTIGRIVSGAAWCHATAA
jgi:hypothetical protein